MSLVAKCRQIPIVCPGHTRPLADIQFYSIDDDVETQTLLASACHDRMPMIRDGVSGDWIGTFTGHKGAVWSCKLDCKCYLAATASGDFSVKVWDAVTGQEVFSFAHKHIVKTLDFSPDSTKLATGGHEGILRIFNLQQPDVLPICVSQMDQSQNLKIHISKVLYLDSFTVIAAASDGYLRFWNLADNPPSLLRFFQVDAEVRDMEINKSLTMLTVAAGRKVSFFDLKLYELIHSHEMPIHFKEEGGASLHPSGHKFIAGGSDLWLRVFDFHTGQELECHKGHHGPIRCVRYAPDGKTYASGSEDGTIRIWKTDPPRLDS